MDGGGWLMEIGEKRMDDGGKSTLCKLLGYWDGIPMLTFVADPNHEKIMQIMPKNRYFN